MFVFSCCQHVACLQSCLRVFQPVFSHHRGQTGAETTVMQDDLCTSQNKKNPLHPPTALLTGGAGRV